MAWAIWVAFDAFLRGAGIVTVIWAIGSFYLGPLVIPVYFAKRPLKNGELRRGGTAWNVLRNFAIFWTAFSAVALVVGQIKAEKFISTLEIDARRNAANIGRIQGLTYLAALWLLPTCCALLLGVFLRNKSIIENGPTLVDTGYDRVESNR